MVTLEPLPAHDLTMPHDTRYHHPQDVGGCPPCCPTVVEARRRGYGEATVKNTDGDVVHIGAVTPGGTLLSPVTLEAGWTLQLTLATIVGDPASMTLGVTQAGRQAARAALQAERQRLIDEGADPATPCGAIGGASA